MRYNRKSRRMYMRRPTCGRGVNIPIDPQKIATFCFLVVLCEVGSTLQHTKSGTELEYGKVSNY